MRFIGTIYESWKDSLPLPRPRHPYFSGRPIVATDVTDTSTPPPKTQNTVALEFLPITIRHVARSPAGRAGSSRSPRLLTNKTPPTSRNCPTTHTSSLIWTYLYFTKTAKTFLQKHPLVDFLPPQLGLVPDPLYRDPQIAAAVALLPPPASRVSAAAVRRKRRAALRSSFLSSSIWISSSLWLTRNLTPRLGFGACNGSAAPPFSCAQLRAPASPAGATTLPWPLLLLRRLPLPSRRRNARTS